MAENGSSGEEAAKMDPVQRRLMFEDEWMVSNDDPTSPPKCNTRTSPRNCNTKCSLSVTEHA